MLIKEIEEQDGLFTIHKVVVPSFDDYICDLSVMFEAYPTKNDDQLYSVRLGMKLIDKLEEVADRLPELPREKRNNNEN